MATQATVSVQKKALPEVDLISATDESLVEHFRASGQASFFEVLVRRYERELFAFLRRFLGNVQQAEDCFQATFITVHQNLDKFEAGRRFRPWLYAVATNKAIDFKRHAKRRAAYSLDSNRSDDSSNPGSSLAGMVASNDPGPLSDAIDNETRRHVREMVERLSESTQLLIQMAFYQGMKYSDIGEALGIPVGTVKSRVFNAVRKLNELWQRRFQENDPLDDPR